MDSAVDDIFAILVLLLVAGGGIIVIDWLIIQRIRGMGTQQTPEPALGKPRDDSDA